MKLSNFLPLTACVCAMCLMAIAAPGGVVFSNLVSFTGTGGAFPGSKPYSGLVVGADGSLYGATSAGGSNNLGTVFQLTPGGVFTSFFSFNGTNGSDPSAALTPAGNGMLYGTTFAGGVSNWGTIFLITTNGAFTNLFSFTGTNVPWQGVGPASALVPDGNGGFYGTADYGGVYTNAFQSGYGYGTIFEIGADGSVTVPFGFNKTNGAYPAGGLVPGKDGNFYGTTTFGGNIFGSVSSGYGTIFRLNPDGTFTNIYKFTGFGDGGYVYAGLVQGSDGWLYGGTFQGGTYGYGTLFKVSTNGDFVLLHTFTSSDRGTAYAGLMQGSDGNFYGTTYGWFSGGAGTVFQMTPGGAFTNLVFFPSGAYPAGVLVQGPDNNLYGTTSGGPTSSMGTVFRLSIPMPAVFKAITVTNGAPTFTWSAVVGQSYQLQWVTNLTQNNWSNLTPKIIIPATGNVTTTDATAADSPQRFYRVVLYP